MEDLLLTRGLPEGEARAELLRTRGSSIEGWSPGTGRQDSDLRKIPLLSVGKLALRRMRLEARGPDKTVETCPWTGGWRAGNLMVVLGVEGQGRGEQADCHGGVL